METVEQRELKVIRQYAQDVLKVDIKDTRSYPKHVRLGMELIAQEILDLLERPPRNAIDGRLVNCHYAGCIRLSFNKDQLSPGWKRKVNDDNVATLWCPEHGVNFL